MEQEMQEKTPVQVQEKVPVQESPFRLEMRQFAKAATTRAVRTMAQTAVSLMSAKTLIGDVDWKTLISAVVMSGVLSILTSVYTGLPETEMTVSPATEGGNDND